MKTKQYGMTTGWIFFTWACFVAAIGASVYIIYNANIEPMYKAFFLISDLMIVQSSISLAKMIRDKSEFDQQSD